MEVFFVQSSRDIYIGNEKFVQRLCWFGMGIYKLQCNENAK